MNREAINYVKEAEARVEELRANGEKEMKEIKASKALSIDKIKEQTEHELSAYRKEQIEDIETKLQKDESLLEEQVEMDAQRFSKTYETNKDRLANRIAEEVLHRYGHSQNEKTDLIS